MERLAEVGLIGICAALAAVIALGVIGLMRGTSPRRSQRLMRWRIALQAVALVLLAGILWFRP
jgi:hypothetical protein